MAAVLLAGRATALARWVPQHELVFVRYTSRVRYDARQNLKQPILPLLETLRALLSTHLGVATTGTTSFQELTVPDLTWWTAREAVLNAIVHRDYFLRQSVYVEVRPGRVEVTSPGGFVGGVSPDNVLRHAPVRRNPLLADVLEAMGFVNRAGLGVDRIYDELLRAGKGLPGYEADEATVRLILPTTSNLAFARFVAEETRSGRLLELDDLILLQVMADRQQLDRWSAARYVQTSDEDAAGRLVRLRERGYVAPRGRGRGTRYMLARALSGLVRDRPLSEASLVLDEATARSRVLSALTERGKLTNTDIRRLLGCSRGEAARLMRMLRVDGLVSIQGRGRAAHYVPGRHRHRPKRDKARRREAR